MDATNPVGALGVMLRQRKQTRLIEAPQDDFALGHLGLVSVMTIRHGRREHTLRPQCSLDEFVLGHSRRPCMLASHFTISSARASFSGPTGSAFTLAHF